MGVHCPKALWHRDCFMILCSGMEVVIGMKGQDNSTKLAVGGAHAWFSIVIPAIALQYAWVASRDERRGLTYTAAMHWRKAAEIFGPNTRIAEYFWCQWERIMQLPRRLAGPF